MNRFLPYIIGIIAICLVIAIYYDTDTLWHNQYDDSYITYRVAVNLAEGRGMVFNEGERIEASSSFLYVIILAGFYRIGFHNLETVSFVVNMMAVGVIAGFVYLSGFVLLSKE
jgi:hypothetical protein